MELMEDVGVYSTVLQPRISRVDTSGFGSGGALQECSLRAGREGLGFRV